MPTLPAMVQGVPRPEFPSPLPSIVMQKCPGPAVKDRLGVMPERVPRVGLALDFKGHPGALFPIRVLAQAVWAILVPY